MNTKQPQKILNLVWQLAMTVKKQKKYFHHSAIASFLTRENLAILAQHRMSSKILQSILAKLEIPDRVQLCRDILPAIDIVPDDWRAIVFANSYTSYKAYPADSISENELEWLIHFQHFRKKYCQHGRSGCNELKCLDLAPPKIKPWSPKLQDSITQDHIPSFMLLVPMEQSEITPDMLVHLLDNGALGIFSTLLEHDDVLPIKLTMKQILYYAVSHLDDRTGMAVINLLERKQPGIVADTVDPLGNDLLWYGMHNYRIPWFIPNCAMIERLLELGCNPARVNHLRLSFQLVRQSLSMGTKLRKMASVYHNVTSPESLLFIKKLYGNTIKEAVIRMKASL
ncbi:MAG: hypothetical protein J6X49_18970 [Victivallales bacterium]|nr:hypothetical protein [Victivallales bacterium]